MMRYTTIKTLLFNVFLLFLFQTGSHSLYAQQLPIYAQFRSAQGFINPASVSHDFFLYEYNVNIRNAYRAQWVSQEDTPRTLQFSGEFISNFGGSFELVTGAYFLKDQTGPMGLTGTYGRIGALFTKDPYFGAFGVGFSFGYARYQVAASSINWSEPDDPNILINDFSLSKPDLGVGLFYYKRLGSGYYSKNNIYLGLSIPQVFGAQYLVTQGVREGTLERVRHYYLTGGWYHFFNQDSFLELSSWIKYVEGSGFNMDLNARFQPGRVIWFGGGLNLNGLVGIEGGINMPDLLGNHTNLAVSYSFNYSLSALGLRLGSAHELVLNFQLSTY